MNIINNVIELTSEEVLSVVLKETQGSPRKKKQLEHGFLKAGTESYCSTANPAYRYLDVLANHRGIE